MLDDAPRPELCTCEVRPTQVEADGSCPVCGGILPWLELPDEGELSEEPLSVDAIHPDAPDRSDDSA